ncbi:MAG: RHS repeat-associated core domain-containing protein [Acidobacteria bacterium]|nr:RHS repeat-associated core domain-containing protein [Acidobacteriota bacterium]
MSEIDYTWSIDNLVTQRDEYDSTTGNTSVVTFGYDDRHRLISESRTVDNPYSLSYTYDELGNRLTKADDSDTQNVVTTTYAYDITDPDLDFPTTNNRLMDYGVDYDDDGTDDRAVFYTYYQTGHVSNITIKDEGVGAEYDKFRDLALYYTRGGTLWLAVWGNFNLDGGGDPENYTVTAAREFRYDNPRQRYLTRDYNVSGGNLPANWEPEDLASWTDYNGMMPYLDFDLSSDVNDEAVVDEATRYLAGMGIAARQDHATSADEFLHGDLIRSTVLTTDESGTAVSAVSYTAFGQLVTSAGIGGELPAGFPRYAYAGGWGYESDLLVLDGAPGTESIVLQHVGARWYQPDTGRFIMRDPIGIGGGLNVYVYVLNQPTSLIDPNGESWWDGSKRWVKQTFTRDNALDVARHVSLKATGPPGPAIGVGVCTPFAKALEIGPDIIRTWSAIELRRRLIDGGGDSDAWDKYERDHKKHIPR